MRIRLDMAWPKKRQTSAR